MVSMILWFVRTAWKIERAALVSDSVNLQSVTKHRLAGDRHEFYSLVPNPCRLLELRVVLKRRLGLRALELSHYYLVWPIKPLAVHIVRHEPSLDVNFVLRQKRLSSFLILCKALWITHPEKPHGIKPVIAPLSATESYRASRPIILTH